MTRKDGKPCKKCGTSEWYKNSNCKQCLRDYTRQWQQENAVRVREKNRRWAAANPEKKRESQRRWKKRNPEKVYEDTRRWRRENPEKMLEIRRTNQEHRRARKKGNGGSYTADEWKEVVQQQDGRCLACGKKARLTVDHVLPLSLGGRNDISNIQGLCLRCNSRKYNKHIDYRKGGKGIKRWIQKKLF